jgi:polynucleotide 5'-hydroxyl-kinase GRC3/NOL9
VRDVGTIGEPGHTQVPPEWAALSLGHLAGALMVIGAPDTGKSTLARYLYRRLCATHERVAFIDGDIGQATLGPPTTMTLVVRRAGEDGFPPAGPHTRFFVGDTSPRGHLLPMLIGLHKLVGRAREMGAAATVLDTTGLVDRAQAGGVLKQAKVDLLQPTAVLALQRSTELEHLLGPLRRSARTRVVDLPVPAAVRLRDVSARRGHRAQMFRRYFATAGLLEVPLTDLAVFPHPTLHPGQLLALEEVDGFALALGVVVENDRLSNTLLLRTPARSLDGVDAMRVGQLVLDPHTCQER